MYRQAEPLFHEVGSTVTTSFEHGGTSGVSGGRSGDVTWLIMGGGALKGLAHIGAWKAVQEAGV